MVIEMGINDHEYCFDIISTGTSSDTSWCDDCMPNRPDIYIVDYPTMLETDNCKSCEDKNRTAATIKTLKSFTRNLKLNDDAPLTEEEELERNFIW